MSNTKHTSIQQDKNEHILVCLSPSPTNRKLIQTASTMAKAYNGAFTAIFVQTPEYEKESAESKDRLNDNINFARRLGATVTTVYGDNIAVRIGEYARLSGITKIVIGKNSADQKLFRSKQDIGRQLSDIVTDTDIHIIPDGSYREKYRLKGIIYGGKVPGKKDLIKTALITLVATGIGLLFDSMNINEANIITLYILGVLITAISTQGYGCSVISALVSVPLFDFLFTEPRFAFHVTEESYPVTFLIMLAVSLITGTLTTRLKHNAAQSARSAYRTKILFDTNQMLKNIHDEKEIISICARQIKKLLGRDTIAYTETDGKLGEAVTFAVNPDIRKNMFLFIAEEMAAKWTLAHRKPRGRGTDNLSDTKGVYLPVEAGDTIYGVIGIMADDTLPDFFEQSVVTSIIGECALAMENARNVKERQLTAEKMKSEQLRSNLLRTISHDLRTPLTTISGNADNLLSNYEKMEETDIKQAFSDIYKDAQWLTGVVENILSVTRMEEGKVNLNLSDELIEDVLLEAVNYISRKKAGHNIKTIIPDDILMARIDRRLIVQVIINLVENAIKYTPPGSDITVRADKKEDIIYISVADNGPGISPQDKEHIFEMFYTRQKKTADSRRSLGLGLALCKSIVNAHGGSITVSDNVPRGSVFTFTLASSEVKIHE